MSDRVLQRIYTMGTTDRATDTTRPSGAHRVGGRGAGVRGGLTVSSRRLAAPASPLAYDGTVAERVVGDGMLTKWVRSVELIRSVLDPPDQKTSFLWSDQYI